MFNRGKKKLLAVSLAGAAALALSAGLAFAVIPGGDGTIQGCYNANGNLRVVDEAADCNPNETPLAWSQTGPQGEQGVQGEQGIQGEQGVQGEPGPQGDPGPITDIVFSGHVLNGIDSGGFLTQRISVSPELCVGVKPTNNGIFGDLSLPVGATITGVTAYWYDVAATADAAVTVWKRPAGGGPLQGVNAIGLWSNGSGGHGSTFSVANEIVDAGEQFMVSFVFPTGTEPAASAGMCGVEIHLS
ncbi:MAG: hypothetical protein ACR2OD_04775 [Gaiellaceae bacterium]